MVPNAAILTACALHAGGFFTPRVARMANPAHPEGCTSRLGRAGRVSSGAVAPGRYAANARKGECYFC